MRTLQTLTMAVALLGAVACVGFIDEPPPTGAGSEEQPPAQTDAGTLPPQPVSTATDAGTPIAGVVDAGALVPPTDAGGGPTPDAGSPGPTGRDAGSPDAGHPLPGPSDAGAPDAGVVVPPPPRDAGTSSPSDAGVGVPANCTPLQGTVTSLVKDTYCVVGDVIVPTGVTLHIPAGTTFIVRGKYHFGRDPALPDLEPPAIPGSGSIHAIGTAAEPIVFRGEAPDTGWFGIVVSHSHDTVHFEWVTIRDTNKDDRSRTSRIWRRGGALGSYVNVKGTILRHCTFINNRAWSVAGAVDLNSHGSWPDEGPVEITDSLFEDNTCECGVYSGVGTDVCGGGAIRFSHIGGNADLVKIRNNVFRNNQSLRTTTFDAFGGAIGGFDSSLIIGPGNVFEGNHASTNEGAISCANVPQLGLVIDGVDPSVTFANNSPNNGCGQ